MRTADIAKPRLRPRIRAANGRFRQRSWSRPKPVRRLWGRTPHCIFQPEAIAKGDTLFDGGERMPGNQARYQRLQGIFTRPEVHGPD